MKILVAFGTTEGQTRKIAQHVAKKCHDNGHQADIYDCARRLRGQLVEPFDGIIIAASIHEGYHQETVVAFATAHRDQLEKKPSAFISVSLSAAFEDGKRDAANYVERFAGATGWVPKLTHMAGGALKLSEYDYFKEQIIRQVVMAGREVPSGQKDWEFTDWDALDKFVAAFLESMRSQIA